MRTQLQNCSPLYKIKSKTSPYAFACLVVLLFLLVNVGVKAQQSLELGPASAANALPDNNGPTVGPIEFPFVHNIDNPGNDNFTTYLPELTATITFSSQQYSSTQDTDPDGDPNPAFVMGWDFTEINGGNEYIANGLGGDVVRLFNNISESNPDSDNYSSIESLGDGTTGSGINVGANSAVYISGSFEGLRGERIGIDLGNADTGDDTPPRYYMATMTIEFNQPVNDPILHFLGLGGYWEDQTFDDPIEGQSTIYLNTATIELDFVPGSSSSVDSFQKLSGTTFFEVDNTNKRIRNSADVPDAFNGSPLNNENIDTGVGSGSALINADGIETLVFDVYARGMNSEEQFYQNFFGETLHLTIASENLNWAGNGGSPFQDLNYSSDAWMLSFSTQTDPDEVQLTGDECYRMLSSPVEGTTYATLLAPIWTQGMTGSDYSGGDPNVWLWPDVTGEDSSEWAAVPDLTATIPAGSGFLVSVFDDDDFDGTGDGFSKTLTVTGSENAPTTFTDMNSGASGWTLLGNPFKSTIDWDLLFGESGTQNVEDAVYVYDRNTGNYVSYTTTGGGDLTGGLIAPFQGFFVQNSGTDPQVDFTDGVKSSSAGAFYGKKWELSNYVRLEVNGQSLYNSMWVVFSDRGNAGQTHGDALELMPLSSEYALLGTRKTGGAIFDIGHYPIPQEDFEIPISLETTRAGTFTIMATDLDLSFGTDLYFIDLQENKSIRIDENFSYQFFVNGTDAEKTNESMLGRCPVSSPQKAKTVAASDRFLIATSPKEVGNELPQAVALQQNYPNPFNPATQISYELPQQSDVRLEVYDLLGRQVATLVNQTMEAGTHTINFDAGNLSSGVYIYRLQSGNSVLSRKLTVIK